MHKPNSCTRQTGCWDLCPPPSTTCLSLRPQKAVGARREPDNTRGSVRTVQKRTCKCCVIHVKTMAILSYQDGGVHHTQRMATNCFSIRWPSYPRAGNLITLVASRYREIDLLSQAGDHQITSRRWPCWQINKMDSSMLRGWPSTPSQYCGRRSLSMVIVSH